MHNREWLGTILLFFCMFSAILTLLSVADYYALQNRQLIIDGRFDYSKEYLLTINSNDNYYHMSGSERQSLKKEYRRIFDILDKQDNVNIRIENFYLHVGDVGVTHAIDIILCNAFDFREKLDEGFWYIDEVFPCSVIGHSVYNHVYEEKGAKYIDIENERFCVSGFLEDTSVNGSDDRVIIFWHQLTDEFKDSIIDKAADYIEIVIKFESVSSFDHLIDELQETSYLRITETSTLSQNMTADNYYSLVRLVLALLGCVFSIVCLMCGSFIYSDRRLCEINIRIKFGYRPLEIISIIARESTKICFWAELLSLSIYLGLTRILGLPSFLLFSYWYIALILVLGIVINVIITCIKPFIVCYRICH